MSASIVHRGPDDEGFFFDRHVGFGFRRLAILDLSPNGHQPMTTADGRYTVVFNGEIYNYVELRKELASSGHAFRSTGDTEVLLHAYQEWGADCVARLNGMWAFLIFDAHTGNVFGSRDRFGIKPLFVWRGDSVNLFGSEIKCIRASDFYRDRINWRVAAHFLVEGSLDETTDTFYDGVTSIAPGTWFRLAPDGRWTEKRFWYPPETTAREDRGIFARFGELFDDAVTIHSRSDVPLAVHLSGGLDSTSIICALGRLRNRTKPDQEILAFSYMAPEFDERRYIGETIQYTGAKLMTLSSTPQQLWESLGEVLRFHDEPVHSMTALVSYALMRETARQGIKVVLNGQGADETLAGYPSYFSIYWHELLRRNAVVMAISEIASFAHEHHKAFWPLLATQLRFYLQSKLGALSTYRRASVARRNMQLDENSWYSSELLRHSRETPYRNFDLPLRDTLVGAIFRDPLPLYLRIEDRNAMAFSIESRVPFLDYRLVELALAADCRAMMHGPYNKYLLRQGMSGKIPESVRWRVDKMGFPTPARTWLTSNLFEPLSDALSSRSIAECGFVNLPQVRMDLQRFRRGEADLSQPLFCLAQFGMLLEKLNEPTLAYETV
jgi:asparagine synthase (glutamine-hydrolysing)